jgi:hypothetical protein
MRWARLVLMLFLVAQMYDGLFTYVAVTAYGLEAEANFILGTWMGLVGALPTLLVAKTVAVAGGVLLYAKGVHRTLAALTAYYAVAAIGPWIAIYQVIG